MKKTVSEIAKLSGVSVRTLHYYDKIGLLAPSEVTSETGYRYYDDDALQQLQQILFYRELDFPLKEIVQLMKASEYNKEEVLIKQHELLQLKRKRLDNLIKLIHANLEGDPTMSFNEFDTSEMDDAKDKYAQEVKDRWGHTDEYKQSQNKTTSYSKEDWKRVTAEMDELLKQFSECLEDHPANKNVQKLVSDWQKYITNNYYVCTNEILSGLGQMYIADERFRRNIDKFREGTAKLMNEAIAIYVKK
ncbi:MAG: hypothetical protein RLZZ267_835 [Bacillota bacterium]